MAKKKKKAPKWARGLDTMSRIKAAGYPTISRDPCGKAGVAWDFNTGRCRPCTAKEKRSNRCPEERGYMPGSERFDVLSGLRGRKRKVRRSRRG